MSKRLNIANVVGAVVIITGIIDAMPNGILLKSIYPAYIFIAVAIIALNLVFALVQKKEYREFNYIMLNLFLFAFAATLIRGMSLLTVQGSATYSTAFIVFGTIIVSLCLFFLYRRYYAAPRVHNERRM